MSPWWIALLVVALLWLVGVTVWMLYKTRPVRVPGGGRPAAPPGTTKEWAYQPGDSYELLPADNIAKHAGPTCSASQPHHRFRCCLPMDHTTGRHRAGDGDKILAEWSDPLAEHIDTAAALLLPDAPVEREVEFSRDVECWLALGAPEGWLPPPIVKGQES